jgi:hypothetical protein
MDKCPFYIRGVNTATQNGFNFECDRCGTKKFHSAPMPVGIMLKKIARFERAHAKCKKKLTK